MVVVVGCIKPEPLSMEVRWRCGEGEDWNSRGLSQVQGTGRPSGVAVGVTQEWALSLVGPLHQAPVLRPGPEDGQCPGVGVCAHPLMCAWLQWCAHGGTYHHCVQSCVGFTCVRVRVCMGLC